ncbi:hypothetical protein [Euzebya sp.]|uniref:hypothetical protein n=1 Tax=Euzebya sp. TaxID=1971409 RepID=UPI0035198607
MAAPAGEHGPQGRRRPAVHHVLGAADLDQAPAGLRRGWRETGHDEREDHEGEQGRAAQRM